MRDLKEALRPLADQEMPDRWHEIERRPVEPLDEPRRGSRVATYALSLAIVVLAGVVVAQLLPLGSNEPTPKDAGTQPPAWLVDTAYQFAYTNGDITPSSSAWALSDAATVAPALGLASGDPSTAKYLVVMHGEFTGYMAKVPPGTDQPTGSVLTFAASPDTNEITDWGIGDQDVNIPGLQPFTLPDATQTYVDDAGWSVPVPPGWFVQKFDLPYNDTSLTGAMFSNEQLEPPTNGGGNVLPQASADGFPENGVALVISSAVFNWGGEKVWEPPLSIGDFTQGSAPAGASYLDTLVFSNGESSPWFTATIRIGSQGGSAIDQAAVASMVESLKFGASSSTGEPIPSTTPSPTEAQPSVTVQLHVPSPGGVVLAFGDVWVQSGDELWKVSPDGQLMDRFIGVSTSPGLAYMGMGGGGYQTLAAGFDSLWTLTNGNVLRVDPTDGHVIASIPVANPNSLGSLAVGEGAVWVACCESGTVQLLRIDPQTNRVGGQVGVPQSIASLAVGAGAVWVLGFGEVPYLQKIDPIAMKKVDEIAVGARGALAAGTDAVWVMDHGTTLEKVDATSGKIVHDFNVPGTMMAVAAVGQDAFINAGDLVKVSGSSGDVTTILSLDKPELSSAGIAVDGTGDHPVIWLTEPSTETLIAVQV